MSKSAGHLLEWNRSRLVAPEGARRDISERKDQIRRVVGEVVLTVTALAGVAVTGVTVLATVSGIRPLVVRSGSMAPTIPSGSMILVQRVEAAELEVDDIVAVERPDRSRVTHRVVALDHQGDVANLTLKGDANQDVDPGPVVVRVADRLVWRVPTLGRAAAWLATAPGGFAMGSLATWAVCRLGGRCPGLRRRRTKTRLRLTSVDAP